MKNMTNKKGTTAKGSIINATNNMMIERNTSNASSVRSIHNGNRPQTTASRIFLGDSPSIDLEKCREQLKLENVHLPDKIDPEMIGKPDEYFDGRNEECFVLDSFNSLIQAARCAKKDFLMARVMTLDPNDPTKTYWSYYSAHQLNKILFRTQTEELLLHRMRCRNPLNNMLIVGSVHYFSISCQEVDRAHAEYESLTGEKVRALSGLKSHGSVTSLLDIDKQTYPLPVLEKSLSHTNVMDSLAVASQLTAPSAQANIPSKDDTAKVKVIEYRAKFLGTDEDFLHRQNFRDIFDENAVNPGDRELFALQSTGQQPVRMVLNNQGQPVQVAREPMQRPSWKNLGGMIYWPPRDSVFVPKTGILNEWSFALIALVTIGVTVGLGLSVLPIWALLVGGPVAAGCLALVAFTLVHFRD